MMGPTKRMHPGWAAHSGVVAAQLASRGFQAPVTVLEGWFGLFATHVGMEAFDPERLSRGLGDEWETTRIAFKPYPVCHFSHALCSRLGAVREGLSVAHRSAKPLLASILLSQPFIAFPVSRTPRCDLELRAGCCSG
jgi:2-methylcitrate dehydratase PrpD